MKIVFKQYFVAHQPCSIPHFENAAVIQVGSLEDFSSLRDNSADNIASKNTAYCELTAMYWLWKNEQNCDLISFNHYRRWFSLAADPAKACSLLDTYDLILPKKEPYKESVYEQYCLESGFAKDLDLLRALIEKKYPNYLPSWDEVMKEGAAYQYNMMIAPKEIFDAYCSFAFDLFFEMEKHEDLTSYNEYQKRIYGFLSERLLNVFVRANGYRIYEDSVVQPHMGFYRRLRMQVRRARNRLSFALRPGR